ncbi:MAG: cellulose binding domain-containing protein, partial [Planctomycetota bacterium]
MGQSEPAGPIQVTLRATEVWSGGYSATIEIANRSDRTVAGWTLEFDHASKFTSLWDGTYEVRGSRY